MDRFWPLLAHSCSCPLWVADVGRDRTVAAVTFNGSLPQNGQLKATTSRHARLCHVWPADRYLRWGLELYVTRPLQHINSNDEIDWDADGGRYVPVDSPLKAAQRRAMGLAENTDVRLFLTVGQALLAARRPPDAAIACRFRVMPWDVGIATLKSDRYFSVADAAQFDFAIRTGLLRPLLGEGVRWINLAQACRFQRPLRLFQAYSVVTRVACVDKRHAYFSHGFQLAGQVHAEVLVKVKFKSGRVTVAPERFFPQAPTIRNAAIDALDALDALG